MIGVTTIVVDQDWDNCGWCWDNCGFFATIVGGCDNCEHCDNCDHKSGDNFFKNWHNDTFYAELPDMKLLWAKFLRVTSWDPEVFRSKRDD